VPKVLWPQHPGFRALIDRHWHPAWGDRRQEIVFIGRGMDEAALRAALDACILDCDRVPLPGRLRLTDPFPPWRHHHAA
jgi:hypothetical protein